MASELEGLWDWGQNLGTLAELEQSTGICSGISHYSSFKSSTCIYQRADGVMNLGEGERKGRDTVLAFLLTHSASTLSFPFSFYSLYLIVCIWLWDFVVLCTLPVGSFFHLFFFLFPFFFSLD